ISAAMTPSYLQSHCRRTSAHVWTEVMGIVPDAVVTAAAAAQSPALPCLRAARLRHGRSPALTARPPSSPMAGPEISPVGVKMSRTTERSRERILEAGFRLFFREGYARVSMEMIAAQARMTKRTLYNHFDSKDQRLAAVLESQNRRSLARFKDWTANADETVGGFLDQFFAKTAAW